MRHLFQKVHWLCHKIYRCNLDNSIHQEEASVYPSSFDEMLMDNHHNRLNPLHLHKYHMYHHFDHHRQYLLNGDQFFQNALVYSMHLSGIVEEKLQIPKKYFDMAVAICFLHEAQTLKL